MNNTAGAPIPSKIEGNFKELEEFLINPENYETTNSLESSYILRLYLTDKVLYVELSVNPIDYYNYEIKNKELEEDFKINNSDIGELFDELKYEHNKINIKYHKNNHDYEFRCEFKRKNISFALTKNQRLSGSSEEEIKILKKELELLKKYYIEKIEKLNQSKIDLSKTNEILSNTISKVNNEIKQLVDKKIKVENELNSVIESLENYINEG